MSCKSLIPSFVLLASTILCAQNGPQRDPQALALLSQVLSNSGGSSAIAAITDFTETGTITYSWANTAVPGTTTIKSRGMSQFRIDSQVPGGVWSAVVSNGAGVLNLPDGTSAAVAYQNTLNSGNLTLPIVAVYAAVQDTTVTVIDDGLVALGNGQAHQITVQQNLSSTADPSGQLSKDTKRDYFFDPSSLQLLQIQDIIPRNGLIGSGGVQHILSFSNYQVFNGISAPLGVTESADGQSTWSMSLSSVVFNTGLSDSDFQF